MVDLLSPTFLTAVLAAGIVAGIPLLFASLGETIAEQSGVLNVGLEGMMITGAFAAFVVALAVNDYWIGLLAGGIAGAVVALVMVVFCIRLGLDQIVVGIALVLTAEGATSVLHDIWYSRSFPRLPNVEQFRIPFLSEIPVLGGSVFSQPLVVYVALAGVALAAWAMRRTRWGLQIRAAGERPDSLDAAGVSVVRTRTQAELLCGFLAGVGGGYLALVGAGTFVPFITQGGGFIAIVIAMLARGRPWWCVGGGLLFGISLSITTALQVAGIAIPVDFVQMLPFISVLVVLVLFVRESRLPSALGLPYLRGSR